MNVELVGGGREGLREKAAQKEVGRKAFLRRD
jgi:hypothetical protein